MGEATADSQITWVSVGTALSLGASAAPGKYYIYKKWTADSNHSNSSSYTSVGSLTRSQASDASVSVTTAANAGTYGSAATLVTAANSTSHGTSAAYVGYKLGEATADSQITWVSVGTALSLGTSASAGTYYIYKKWTADSNHSNSSNYTQVATLTRSKANGSGSVTMSGWTYGGTVTNPTPSSSTNGTSNVTYTWYNSGKTALSSKPGSTSTAGTYYVKATFAATTNYNEYTTDYVSFTISKATGSGSVTMSGWTYGGTVTNPTPSSSTNGTSNVTYTWYNSGKTALSSKPGSTSTAGTYYVKATFAATTNYNEYTTDYVSFTISKANINPSISCSNVACGSTTTATVSGNSGSGTVTWSSSAESATVNSSGVVTGVSVTNSVRITASIAETTNYNAGSAYKDIAVTCVTGSTGVSTSEMNITYSSTTGTRSISGNTGSISVSSGDTSVATVSVSGTTITVTREGYGSTTITVTAAASGCYCQTTSSFEVNCYKAAGSVTVTNANPTYGTSNALASVSSATGTVYYKLDSGTWGTPIPTASGLNAGSYTLYYYVAESTNYTAYGSSSSPKSISVTVAKANISPSVSCSNVACGSTTTATVSGNSGSGTVTWSSSAESATVNSSGVVTGVSVTNSVRITASIAETTNYNAGSAYKDIAVTCVTGSTGVSTSEMNITYSSTTGTRSISGNTGSISVSSGDTSVATVSVSGTTITVTRKGYGSAIITVTAAASGCYCQKQSTFTVNCNKAARSGIVSCDNLVYGGSTTTATVSGNTESGTVTWSSSNTSVATVDATGLVTPVAAGTTIISASVAATDNYLEYTPTAKTITVSARTVTVTAPVVQSNTLKYTGSSQGLLSSNGSVSPVGTMYYYCSTSSTTPSFSTSTWSTTAPSKTDVNTTGYYIWYYAYVADTTNNTGTDINTVKSLGSKKIELRDGAAPTFANDSVSATCVQAGSAVNAGVFTTATAGHSGSITYAIQGVVKDGTSTQLSGWTVNSSRVITVPASTEPATYKVTVRATEGATSTDTSSYKDAVITVTLSKGTQTLNLDKTELALTVPNTGTITASGYSGTLTVSSGSTGVATASNTAASTITAVSAGTSTITFSAAATTYVNAVSKTATVTVSRRTGAEPTFDDSSVTATCTQDQSAKTTTAFTAATAGHSGTLSYSLVSVKNSGNTSLSGWSVDSSNRTIGIPADTVSGTYTCVVRCTEGQTSTDTSSYKDATITVTLSKGTQSLSLDKAELALTYPNTGTITASGYVGTLTVSSGTLTVATASNNAESTITSVGAGTSTITFTAAANDYVNSVSKTATVTVSRRTGADPSFGDSTVTATCSQDQSAKTTTAFTAATAGHDGGLIYSLVSAKDSNDTSLNSWSVTSATRKINIPADTVSGTYTCVVRCTEGQTSTDTESYKDATITVTLNKGTQSLTLTGNPVDYTSTYNDGGTIVASGHVGTISASSGTTSVATVSVSSSTVTVTCVGAGTSTITVTAAANDYVNAVSKNVTWTISKTAAILPTNWKGDSKVYHQTATLTAEGYSGGTLKYRYDENNGTDWTETTTAPTRTAIGVTAVQCMVVGDSNHDDTTWSSTVTLTIREADDAHMEVITYDRTYNTDNQVIAEQDTRSGHTAEGIGTYYLGYYKNSSVATQENQITWGSANSSLSAQTSGTYQIYYKFVPDGNHNNSVNWDNAVDHGHVGSVTISKASRSGEVSCLDTTYPGTVQASVSGNTESGTITWGINPGTGTATISNGGLVTPTSAGTVTITASVAETDNYLAYVATSKTITIGKVSLESIVKPSDVVYTGSAFTPTPAVSATVGGVLTTLTLDTDYTLSYLNNTNVGTATVTATGKGNFEGTVSETWSITGATITVTSSNQSYTYDGSLHGTGVTATTVNNQTYSVKYRKTSSGEYNLTSAPQFRDVINSGYNNVVYYQVTADNHITYEGSYQLQITPKEATLSWGTLEWMYDGNPHQTTCTVSNLVSGDACTVTLSNNSITEVGETTVTATSLSNSNYSLPSDVTRTLIITPGVFIKVVDTWSPIKQVYKMISGEWVEQDMNTVFDTSKLYIKLN